MSTNKDLLIYDTLYRLKNEINQDLQWDFNSNQYTYTLKDDHLINGLPVDNNTIDVMILLGYLSKVTSGHKVVSSVTPKGSQYLINHMERISFVLESEEEYIRTLATLSKGNRLSILEDNIIVRERVMNIDLPIHVFLRLKENNFIKKVSKQGDYKISEEGLKFYNSVTDDYRLFLQSMSARFKRFRVHPYIEGRELKYSEKDKINDSTFAQYNQSVNCNQKYLLLCLANGVQVSVARGLGNVKNSVCRINNDNREVNDFRLNNMVNDLNADTDVNEILNLIRNKGVFLNSDYQDLEKRAMIRQSTTAFKKEESSKYKGEMIYYYNMEITKKGMEFINKMDPEFFKEELIESIKEQGHALNLGM